MKKTRTIHRVEIASEQMNTRMACRKREEIDRFLEDLRLGVSSFVRLSGETDDVERNTFEIHVRADTVSRVVVEESNVER